MSGHLSPAGDPNAMLKVAQLHARAFCRFCFLVLMLRDGGDSPHSHSSRSCISECHQHFSESKLDLGKRRSRERRIRILATVLAVDFHRLYG